MIVDTSAIIAIMKKEPEAARIAAAIGAARVRSISSASLVEAGILAESRWGEEGARDLDLLLNELAIAVVPVSARQADLARQAWRRYGKGRRGLNSGDCFAYALAKDTGEPLLFKGDDFAHTDIAAAPY